MKSRFLVCAAAALMLAATVALADVKQPQAAGITVAMNTAPALEVKAQAAPAVHQVKAAPPIVAKSAAELKDALGLLLGLGLFAGMINYIQPGNSITAAAPYQRNTGQGTLLGGNLFGVAVDTVASGATGVFWVEGVFELTKLSGAAESFTLGKRVFWDDTNKRLTVVSTANVCVGVVTEAAATDAVVARIKIWPSTPAGT